MNTKLAVLLGALGVALTISGCTYSLANNYEPKTLTETCATAEETNYYYNNGHYFIPVDNPNSVNFFSTNFTTIGTDYTTIYEFNKFLCEFTNNSNAMNFTTNLKSITYLMNDESNNISYGWKIEIQQTEDTTFNYNTQNEYIDFYYTLFFNTEDENNIICIPLIYNNNQLINSLNPEQAQVNYRIQAIKGTINYPITADDLYSFTKINDYARVTKIKFYTTNNFTYLYNDGFNDGKQNVIDNPNLYNLYNETQYNQNYQNGINNGINNVINSPHNYNLYTLEEYNQYGTEKYSFGVGVGYTQGQESVLNYPNSYDLWTHEQTEYQYQAGLVNGKMEGIQYVIDNPNDYNLYTGEQLGAVAENANTEVIDLPGMMLHVLSMPWTFISNAFDLTLWEGTPYQINFANIFKGLIAILALMFIVKMFTNGFNALGNVASSAEDRKNTKADTNMKNSQAKLNNAKASKIESKKEKK